MVSAMVAAERFRRTLVVIWESNHLCGCSFSDLFENAITLSSGRMVIDFNDDATGRPAFLARKKTMFYEDVTFNLFQKTVRPELDIFNTRFFTGRPDQAANEFSRALNSLVPTRSIQARIPALPANTYGFHVRRKDLPLQDRSPVDAFLRRIEMLLAQDDSSRVFLATDCGESQRRICATFGTKVIVQESMAETDDSGLYTRRKTASGVQRALIDLLGLSRTKKVFGTYNSSFSWLAAMWRLVDMEIVQKEVQP